MATFKALLSKRQMFSVGSCSYRFTDGMFSTKDKKIISALRDKQNCEEIIDSPSKPIEPSKPEKQKAK